jgi:DNA mismatch repair ATPase MutS
MKDIAVLHHVELSTLECERLSVRDAHNPLFLIFFPTCQVRYQLEVPMKTVPRVPARGWELQSATKTVKRYWTAESKRLAGELTKLELEQEAMDKDTSRRVFAGFAEDYQVWSGTVDVLAELDCLLSLAQVSANHVGCVRPKFVSYEAAGRKSFIDLKQAVHPALYETQMQKHMDTQPTSFIPNDTVIGTGDCPAKFVLVSGPNMGGQFSRSVFGETRCSLYGCVRVGVRACRDADMQARSLLALLSHR